MDSGIRSTLARERLAVARLLLALLMLPGCGASTREVTRSTIDEIGTEQNWNKLREPARSLANDVTAGVVQALDDAARNEALNAQLDEYARRFTHLIAQQVNEELGPAVVQQVRNSVAAVLDELTTEQRQQGLAQLMDRITVAAIEGLGESLDRQLRQRLAIASFIERELGPGIARAMVKDLGPATQTVLEQDIGPGLAHVLDGELGKAITTNVGNSAEAAGQRFAAGARQELTPVMDRFFDRLQGAMQEGQQSASSLVQVIMAVVLALIVGILGVLLLLRHREARARSNALHLVVREISKRSGVDPAVLELVAQIKKEGQGTEGGDALAAFLRQHPTLKVKPEGLPSGP